MVLLKSGPVPKSTQSLKTVLSLLSKNNQSSHSLRRQSPGGRRVQDNGRTISPLNIVKILVSRKTLEISPRSGNRGFYM